ncbi:VAD1-like StAR-related lipid transfer domain-containing protein [Phytophthora infestans]|uniref:VAD1-like StAR-related lipid transfer domain-containing protein n=1 Tax=Phytophthora infestans TaxID=4787 RepID=A0A833SA40_PHYIN|nr:VAD1-like StAR-related lipid transfer domain-containing protein [Phytophthora infestans]
MEDAEDITVKTSSENKMVQSTPSSTGTASEASPEHSNASPTAKSDEGSVMPPYQAQAEGTYSTDLFRAFPKVCQKAKSGVQLCQAVSAFVTERAGLESNYAQSLLKLAQSAKAEDWSEQFTGCWTMFQEATEHLTQERWAFAQIMQSSIVPGAKAFAQQQETQVHRLITEGTKVRWAQQQMISSMDKAKEKYERKCQEAIEITTAMKKSDSTLADVHSSSSESSSEEVLTPKELTDKLAAGAGQLLTKMWDTTSSFGRNPLERQRSRLYSSLDDVIAAEKHYVQTVEYTNAQRPIFEREIKENLHAFQLTEEQRLEYLRDVLMRMQKAFIAMFSRSQQFVERMKASANKVDELADIEKAFQSLGSQDEIDVDRADVSANPSYLRMTHIQEMSDTGHRMVGIISSAVTEFIATETRFSHYLRKLLRTHENGGHVTPTDIFGTLSNATSFLSDEGASMANGWKAVKDQVKLLLEVHQEFRSLLAEPVSLSLATMKSEYENVRVSTQESFSKLHTSLCYEAAAHKKLHQKLDTKAREFAMTFSYLPGATPVATNSNGIDITQALEVLSANVRSFNEKERRSEAKLRQLAEEIRQLQAQVTDNTKSLKQTYQNYVQEIEVFISTCMKNEKYRLQVGKNSLQSLAKAIEHMLQGGTSVGNKALIEFEKIDPSTDMTEFIRVNQQPYEQIQRIIPAYHGNDSLKEAMREYLSSLGASSLSSENVDTSSRSRTSSISASIASLRSETNASSEKKSPRPSVIHERDNNTATTNDANADGNLSEEDESEESGTEQEEDYAESQPLGVSDFQKKFKLDVPEQVVESYSCALYLSNFPYHGRLYLTRDSMCFSGWIDTVFVASLSDISAMEKKNTALIVPNAIEFTVKGEKVFFASFVYRDECYQSIQQLRSIKKETEELMSDPAKQPDTEFLDTDNKPVTNGESRRRRSSKDLAAVAPSPDSTSTDTTPTEDSRSPSSPSSDSVSTPPTVPDKDTLLSEYDMLMDEEVEFSIATAYATLWVESDTFSRNVLEAAGATKISLPAWEKKSTSYTAVTSPDTFDGSRVVSYTHNKKYMVGPSVIPTTQTQRYAYKPNSRLVVSTTTCVSDVPYCDYFRVEHRWVFSATKKRGVCLAQVGLRVQWMKSTWLKKQIESTTVTEAKDAIKSWLNAAHDTIKENSSTSSSAGPPPPASKASAMPSESESKQDALSTKPSDESAAVTKASPNAPTSTTINGLLTRLHPTIQVAVAVCALMFFYTMYRVCAAIDHMQALTRESLIQQRQQHELLKELLEMLGRTRE